MKKFGVDIKIEENYKRYSVIHQIYKPTTFSIPSDFSNLALLLAANVLLGDGLTINFQEFYVYTWEVHLPMYH